MSDWTYIKGSVKLRADCYDYKKNKDGTYKKNMDPRGFSRFIPVLPYPDEQLRFVRSGSNYIYANHYTQKQIDKFVAGKAGLEKPAEQYNAVVIAFPVIKRAVEKHIDDLPAGESDEFPYFINYDKESTNSSTSTVDCKQIQQIFQEWVMQQLRSEGKLWKSATWKDIKEYYPSEIDWVEENTEAILTLHDSVRYCVVQDMYEGIMKLVNDLASEGLEVADGVLMFEDYTEKCTVEFDSGTITVRFESINDVEDDGSWKEWHYEPRVEYWQEFTVEWPDRPWESEYKKVDKLLPYKDRMTDMYAAEDAEEAEDDKEKEDLK